MTNENYAPPKSSVLDPDARPTPTEPGPGPQGLGGWLVLVCIGLVVSAVRLVFQLYNIYVPIFGDGAWGLLTTPGLDNYHPLWAPILILEIVWNVSALLVGLYLLMLFFKRASRFRPIYVALLIVTPIVIVLDAWLVTKVLPEEPMFDPDTTKELGRAVVGLFIWVPYMLVSKRVKNTFLQ
jgi:Protein of unknown function (DUF2569)